MAAVGAGLQLCKDYKSLVCLICCFVHRARAARADSPMRTQAVRPLDCKTVFHREERKAHATFPDSVRAFASQAGRPTVGLLLSLLDEPSGEGGTTVGWAVRSW